MFTVRILACASTLQLVACRVLLYSTMTFYMVRVLFHYKQNVQILNKRTRKIKILYIITMPPNNCLKAQIYIVTSTHKYLFNWITLKSKKGTKSPYFSARLFNKEMHHKCPHWYCLPHINLKYNEMTSYWDQHGLIIFYFIVWPPHTDTKPNHLLPWCTFRKFLRNTGIYFRLVLVNH